MANKVNPVPPGFHTVTPHLIVRDAAAAIDFYRRAFGAEEIFRMPGPNGQGVAHAEIRLGNSVLMLAEEWPGLNCKGPTSLGGTSVKLHLYVDDCDALFDRAVKAGAKASMPVADMFWGDRYGTVTDPFGHDWGLATHKEDLTPEEMDRRAKIALAEMAAQ